MQERIKNIGKYFQGMNVAPSPDGTFIMYIEVKFPGKWIILENTTTQFNVQYAPNETKDGYYFWGNADNSDGIFNAIEMNIKVNEDAEKKISLLMQKIQELQDIFANEENTLEKLNSLEFTFSTPKPKTKTSNKPSTKSKTKTKIVEEPEPVVSEEIMTEDEIMGGL